MPGGQAVLIGEPEEVSLVRRSQLCGEVGPNNKYKLLKGKTSWGWHGAGTARSCMARAQCAGGDVRRQVRTWMEAGRELVVSSEVSEQPLDILGIGISYIVSLKHY